MSSRPFESPPPYRPDEFKPSHYAPSNNTYGGEFHSQPMFSQPAYSYYPEDEVQRFYKWSSPPGIIKIMSVLILVMCIGVFACVASTLAWDMDLYGGPLGTGLGYPSYGGFGTSYGGYSGSSGFGSFGGYNGAYGLGGNYIDPRAAKGFILAMAAFGFIAGLVVFVTGTTKTKMARTRKYYLFMIIASAILLFLMFIATIVYILAVNPTAQASGSVFYNQIYMLCNQFYAPTTSGLFVNQYLYHYCVVEPQEAIAIILGFLIVAALGIIIFFAVKTRSKMDYYGKMNILWDNTKGYDEAPNVEEWVKNVSAEPEAAAPGADYPDQVASSMGYSLSDAPAHQIPNDNYTATPVPEVVAPLTKDLKQSQYVNTSSYNGSAKEPPQKRKRGRTRRANSDNYNGDYITGGESCDELEENWDREYPPVSSDQKRQAYKRDFDTGLQEYKQLQAELDEISRELSRLDKELDDYIEGSEEYKAAADEYNRLKDIKSSADYKNRKAHCKMLRSKLSHIKRMVSDYDSQKL
ncbi:occludin isoform X3 [Python bivittatus]|uniref:Occludin n=1 Tax=Python bivittatus TaxID=176946 RepID=A0A9F2WLD7_PYTBI|nr:occludin isoform X3 [Python bivittatus]